VQQDLKVFKASREIQETQEQQVHRVTLARQEQLGLKVIRVILEPLVRLDRQDHKVRRAILVQLVPLALLVQQGLKVLKATKVYKVFRGKQAHKDQKVTQG
jgi:hypothetical protein